MFNQDIQTDANKNKPSDNTQFVAEKRPELVPQDNTDKADDKSDEPDQNNRKPNGHI